MKIQQRQTDLEEKKKKKKVNDMKNPTSSCLLRKPYVIYGFMYMQKQDPL